MNDEKWNRLCDITIQIKAIETQYPWFKEEPEPDPYTGLLEEVPWQTDEEQAIYSRYDSLKAQRDELTNPITDDDIPF